MRRANVAPILNGSASVGKKILIVDDDRTMTNLLKTLLELDDFEVKTVNRGGDAVSQATSFQPEAFIVDFHLHDMEGGELVQQLRTRPAFATSLIFITPVVVNNSDDNDQLNIPYRDRLRQMREELGDPGIPQTAPVPAPAPAPADGPQPIELPATQSTAPASAPVSSAPQGQAS